MKPQTTRTTVYLDSRLHNALITKSAQTERSMSDLVNEAVKQSFLEDVEDLAAFQERINEPDLPFEDEGMIKARR